MLASLLAELHAKYDALVRLREAQDRGDPHDPRPHMRALAARHPGALRELDVLPLHVLHERRELLARALAGASPPR